MQFLHDLTLNYEISVIILKSVHMSAEKNKNEKLLQLQ